MPETMKLLKRKNGDSFVLYRLVRTAELSIRWADQELELRMETFESTKPARYRVRLWRYETFRLQPTFPQSGASPSHAPSDEFILKEFESFYPSLREPGPADSADAAETAALTELRAWLMATGQHRKRTRKGASDARRSKSR
jgi:hypothetical protein